MTTRNRPNYGIFYLALNAAGTQDIPALGTRIAMIGAYVGATISFTSGGGQQINGGTPTSALVNIQIGKALGDVLPFTVGSKIRVDNKFDFLRASWAAQAGVIAIVAVSDDAEGNGIEFDAPPTVSLGNFSLQQGGNTAAVTSDGALKVAPGSNSAINMSGAAFAVSTTAVQSDGVTGVVKRLAIAPLTNTSIVWVGGAGVVPNQGIPLWPGDSIEIEAAASPYFIASSGTQSIVMQRISG